MDTDTFVQEFYGGGEYPGIPALSPLFYAPFMSSPELDEDGNLLTHMGREWAYEASLDNSEFAETDGTSKFGFVPEIEGVQGIEDLVDALSGKKWQFSAGVRAERLEVVAGEYEGTSLFDAYSDVYEELEGGDMAADTKVNVRVGKQGGEPWTFDDFLEGEWFEGIVSLPHPENGEAEVTVRADYTDYDQDEFTDVAWNHFLAHCGGIWDGYSLRPDAGAMESRDFGNSPRIREAIETQAGIFRKWRELQEYVDSRMDDIKPEELREGVAREGLTFQLAPGYTVRDLWEGGDDEEGMLGILADGVRDASFGDADGYEEQQDAYAERYVERMEEYLEEGSYSRRFAQIVQEDGVEAALEDTVTARGGDRDG